MQRNNDPEPTYFENFDLESIVTPVNVNRLEELLLESNFDNRKTKQIVSSFRLGFDLGYTGDYQVKKSAPNLKLRVGSEVVLWNKVMKEVKLKRFAGPYEKIPFQYYIQSPIGLVPKDDGKDTRLIFHLSYPRDGVSVNSLTNPKLCSVSYPSFDEAVKICMAEQKGAENLSLINQPVFVGKSDMRSAFRNLGMKRKHFCFLVMKAKSPFDGKYYYFIDKCLPFGSSISCAHFQGFSDAIAHIMVFRTGKQLVNYLDDFLFAAWLRSMCNEQIQMFLNLC